MKPPQASLLVIGWQHPIPGLTPFPALLPGWWLPMLTCSQASRRLPSRPEWNPRLLLWPARYYKNQSLPALQLRSLHLFFARSAWAKPAPMLSHNHDKQTTVAQGICPTRNALPTDAKRSLLNSAGWVKWQLCGEAFLNLLYPWITTCNTLSISPVFVFQHNILVHSWKGSSCNQVPWAQRLAFVYHSVPRRMILHNP